ncbi:MAG TPA: hypothetical protein VGJ26_13725 [Pirellulales bacterium]
MNTDTPSPFDPQLNSDPEGISQPEPSQSAAATLAEPRSNSGGRPRALNEIKQREVCALVSAGCGIESAARYIGCASSTIRREAERNPQFGEALRAAHLNAELNPLHALRRAAQNHWRAAAWLLERFNPERFARQDVHRLTPKQLQACLSRAAQVIADEVKDADAFARVCVSFDKIVEECNQEMSAAEFHPRGAATRSRLAPTPLTWPNEVLHDAQTA